MLPSKGFFKKTDCPFFEKGLCVRPHCHFRHKKKIVNDESVCTDAVGLEDGNEEAEEEDLFKFISNYDEVSDDEKKPSSSTSVTNESEDQSSHDTLFAKLVNQTNTYEKINKHIPCAYTPTPQSRSAEPKNKTISAGTGFANSEKSLELITKARTLLQNYCAENIKKFENKHSGSGEKKSDRNYSNLKNESAPSDDGSDVKSSSKGDGCRSECGSPKGAASGGHDVTGCGESDPSKGKIPSEGEYPEKDHEPDKGGGDVNQPGCDPSGADSSGGSKCEPNDPPNSNDNCKLDGKSGTCQGSYTSYDVISQLEFISSEIEMMKKFLKEEDRPNEQENMPNEKQCLEKSESEKIERLKGEDKVKEGSRSNHHHHHHHHHKSSSRHKSKSSDSHSSSRSKHSSHSSRHSRHSRSSDRNHSSSSGRHSSSRHRKSSSRHGGSSRRKSHGERSDAELGGRQHSKSRGDCDGSDRARGEGNQIRSSSSAAKEEDDDDDDDGGDNNNDDSEMDCKYPSATDEDEVTESKSRKRKNSLSEDVKHTKYISLCNDDDEDPAMIEKECLEIFNSYATDDSKVKSSGVVQEVNIAQIEYENSIQGKKRTAHSTSVLADHSALRQKTYSKPHVVKSAQEVLLDRYKICEKARESQQQTAQPNTSPMGGLSSEQMLLAKKAIQDKISRGLKVNERTTIAHTVSQGGSRVAHVPKISDLKEKPSISDGSKQVPRVKRQTYLDKLLVETNQIYPTKTEAAEEALKLEQEIFRLHSGSFAAYHAAFVSLLMKTRRRVTSVRGEATNVSNSKSKVSHFDILSGGKKNFSVIKTKKVELCMLSDKQIYDELLRCKLTPEQLKENGFPVSCDRPGYATCSLNYELKYNEKYQYIKKINGNRRYCIRCSKQYEVDPVSLKQYKEGPETCSYHPGRKKSGGRNCDRIYNCCNSSSTEGCATHVRHVTDCNDYENYPNCVRTLAKDDDSYPGVYALDCEMVYTRLGTELARVTVVNLKKDVVYDTLVKPKCPVECYNTFYSGIEEKMMEGVETTLKDVQAVLLSIFSNKTILIGHSLDSDLRALHLVHDTVVDTSIVYKNEKFHPYKYSLKELCATKISKIIQDNVGGHDSSEDAIAALELMLHYVKEEVAKYDSLESYEADRGK